MPTASISYSPRGVSFSIEDSLTREAEKFAETLMSESARMTLELVVAEDGTVSYTRLGGSLGTFGTEDQLNRIVSFVKSKYDDSRYVSHSQPFLIATNTTTYEQNAIAMDRARAEAVLAESLRNPSNYFYSVRVVESLYDKVEDRLIYENFRYPEKLVKWNYQDRRVVLPERCVSIKEAEKVAEFANAGFAEFLTLDATDVEEMNVKFLEALAQGLADTSHPHLPQRGIRLRGFSGSFCRKFAQHFRYRGERFVSW